MDDVISRQKAIDALDDLIAGVTENGYEWIYKENAVEAIEMVEPSPSAQPYTIHSDGRLWITVDDIDKVTAVVVDEHKSKFCKQFYEDYEDAQLEPSQLARDIARIVENEQDMRVIAQPERIKGRWEQDGHHIKCDQCGEWMCDRDREGWNIPKNYCPNCGADMREVTT